MTIGFVGLGRMGLNMVTRLHRGGHQTIVYDLNPEAVAQAGTAGAQAAATLVELAGRLPAPKAVWMMVPSGKAVERVIDDLSGALPAGGIIIDGGNSNFHDTVRRAKNMADKGIVLLDAGTSGGIWGLEAGYCLMVGGDRQAFDRLEPIFRTLAPPEGYLHVGPAGAGHYVKMIHNGIEYGLMQAYAEGLELLQKSDYDIDLQEVCRLWNHGSVVRSWLLELAERAFAEDPGLEKITDYVEDSGEGRWTIQEAIDKDVPAVSLAYALMNRFRSRQPESFSGKVLASLRRQFGGHSVKERN